MNDKRFEVVSIVDPKSDWKYSVTIDYYERGFRVGTAVYGEFVKGFDRRTGKGWKELLKEDAMTHLISIVG